MFNQLNHFNLKPTYVAQVFLICVSVCFPCQTKVHGRDRVRFMESLVVADIAELKDNQVRGTCLT